MEPTEEKVSFSRIQNLLIEGINTLIKGGEFNLPL